MIPKLGMSASPQGCIEQRGWSVELVAGSEIDTGGKDLVDPVEDVCREDCVGGSEL